MPVNHSLSLCSKFTLHCLLCKNGFGPFKYFSFASWHDVKALSEENAGKTLEEKVVFLPNLACSSWQDPVPCTVSPVCAFSPPSQAPEMHGSQQHSAVPPSTQLVWKHSDPTRQISVKFPFHCTRTTSHWATATPSQPRSRSQSRRPPSSVLFLSLRGDRCSFAFSFLYSSELLFFTNMSFLARNPSAQIICDFSILIKPWLQIKFQATNP